MKVLDPGHVYELGHLDGPGTSILTFVKREGDGYPGNVGHHEGANLQEVLRALIDRVHYLDDQIHDTTNDDVVANLRVALWFLETRAAIRHGRTLSVPIAFIEQQPTCAKCGHIGCGGGCH